MKIISHRGYWQTADEKNTSVAFARSFSLGFGTETDVRDSGGGLVISHDMPVNPAMSMERYLNDLAQFQHDGLVQALNIKSDGLAALLASHMRACAHPWFVFDMSIPDMVQHIRAGNPCFARMSEYETFPLAFVGAIKGIWLDAFESTWYSTGVIQSLLDRGLQVCVVSPELHCRPDHEELWRDLRSISANENLILCTDLPEAAASVLTRPSV
jgi:hypothetical protein